MSASPALPTQLKTARVLLFITAGLAFMLFFVLIVADADQTTLYLGFFAYLGQGAIALTLGLLLARGGTWVLWATYAYTGLVLLWSLLTLLGGDPAGITQMLLPGLVLFLITRPASRAHLRRVRPAA
ncbi:hypothetical protein ACFOVU_02805 [Nocardiopsis sediminis]|uniref:DUF4233 domain-containing protein n=1 Tax=Nocardiopsis sediminis TaxID=1778267 RepID=A0ABV8FIU1_9ACTN